VRLKQAVNKTVKFTLTDSSNDRVDLTGSSLAFDMARVNPQGKVVVQKLHADFDITSAATGEVKVTLNSTDTNQIADRYVGELRVVLASGAVHKSTDINIEIETAIIAS